MTSMTTKLTYMIFTLKDNIENTYKKSYNIEETCSDRCLLILTIEIVKYTLKSKTACKLSKKGINGPSSFRNQEYCTKHSIMHI